MVTTQLGPNVIYALTIDGMTARDFGAEDGSDLEDRFLLAFGEPWVADCAAGLRKACPINIDNYIAIPSVGGTPDAITINATQASWPSGFEPQPTAEPDLGRKSLFLVSKVDPANPSRGKVLAALAVKPPGASGQPTRTREVISDTQRKYINDIIGLGPDWAGKGTQYRPGLLGLNREYCVEDVPRDFFVPLESELTSDSDQFEDSWEHYLDLASLAAMRADELGKEVIAQGLSKDVEAEGAREQLGEICGDFGALDRVKVEDGRVQAPSTDSILATCFDEPKFDVVFLTDDPFAAATDAVATAGIRDLLDCEGEGTSELCEKKNGQYVLPVLSHSGLGLARWEDPRVEEPAPIANCERPMVYAEAASFDPATTVSFAASEYMAPTSIAKLLRQAKFTVFESGHWEVKLNGELLMSTQASLYWPHCIGNYPCGNAKFGAEFQRIFPSQGGLEAALGPLRTRVEGALWRLANWSGGMPPGVFSVPVVAVNFESSTRPERASIATVYGPGQFTYVNGDYQLNEVSTLAPSSYGVPSEQARALIGRPIPTSYVNYAVLGSFAALNGGENPYQLLSQDPGNYYLHVWTTNPDTRTGEAASVAAALQRASNDAVLDCADSNALPSVRGFRRPLCSGRSATMAFHSSNYDGDFPDENAYYVAVWDKFENDLYTQPPPQVTGAYDVVNHSQMISALEATNRSNGDNTFTFRTAEQLSPGGCSPSERSLLFMNSMHLASGCDEQSQIKQAVALACVVSTEVDATADDAEPPPILTVNDLNKLKQWVERQARGVRRFLSMLIARGIPKRAVEDTKAKGSASGVLLGSHGQQVLEIEQGLAEVTSGWIGAADSLRQLAEHIETARIGLEGVQLESDIQLRQLTIERLGVQARLAHASMARLGGQMQIATSYFDVGAYSGGFSGVLAIADADIEEKYGEAVSDLIAENATDVDRLRATNVSEVLHQLQTSSSQTRSGLAQQVESIRSATARVQSASLGLRTSEGKASYIAASAMDADYMLNEGQEVYFPVNTVSRRLRGATKIRYDRALRDAKYLTYMTRLAIEQRIGQRLSGLHQPIGTLDAPSLWADDLCEMTGVDYGTISTFTIPDPTKPDADYGTIESVLVKEVADNYIGDYVTKLRNLVEYYNLEYPSHEADDMTVLSLRDDLLTGGGLCYRPSKNLLSYSNDLTGSWGDGDVFAGWESNPCDPSDTYCLVVSVGTLEDADPPGAMASEGVSWLRETPFAEFQGVDANMSTTAPRFVGQRVALRAGQRYFWTWWDQARSPEGDTATESLVEYQALVQEPTGGLLVVHLQRPHQASAQAPWSNRRTVAFVAPADGDYLIGYKASSAGSSLPGSVAIANVQLEAGQSTEAAGYEATSASRTTLTGDCIEGRPEGLRKAFQHKCDENRCYYELKAPFIVDTQRVVQGKSKISDRLASENFNFRHLTLALNVVGSGVLDCAATPTTSCYGNGTLEYVFRHDAQDTAVIGYDTLARQFDFGSAAIRGGRALAAERVITFPISTSDQALLNQPQSTKPELRGRPLSGAYSLRIYDTPALVWDRVEDIQLVLNYRYWSRVSRSN